MGLDEADADIIAIGGVPAVVGGFAELDGIKEHACHLGMGDAGKILHRQDVAAGIGEHILDAAAG